MTKKTFFLMLMLIMMSVASVNAQVRIGGLDDPNESAILDLNASDAADNGTLGLALPRVALTSTAETVKKGMIVYNTATANDVTPGTYYNDGSKWIRLESGTLTAAPIITAQPKSFSWSRMKETNGDPNSTVTSFSPTLTITASGEGLSYQWYKKAVNRNAADALIAGETTNSYKPTLTAWGMDSYYCVVSNAYGSVTSNIAEVAAGCGARTSDGGWLKFMCHNLGALSLTANQSLDEITFAFSSAADKAKDDDAKGWLFQWGRAADGHQSRSSVAVGGPVTLSNAAQTPSGENTNKFVTNGANATFYDWRAPQYDYLWRNWNDSRFPCPAGWKVPSSSDWGAIYRSGSTYGTPEQATANTWVWKNSGYVICPDGVTATLFLSAAGVRDRSSAALNNVGTVGYYWSRTPASSGAYYLLFNSSRVSPETGDGRTGGHTVRCVAE
jgi:uncharacterized protein (TIGR02145 family)